MYDFEAPCAALEQRETLEMCFLAQGFGVVNNLLEPSEIRAAKREIGNIIVRARTSVTPATPDDVEVQYEPGFTPSPMPSDPEFAVRKLMHLARSAHFHELAHDSRILGLAERLIGPEPVLLQSMALLKPAGVGSVKDWHQDAPYFDVEPGSKIGGIWIALDHADEENGCMQVLPKSHHDGVIQHETGPTGWRLPPGISERFAREAMPVPLVPGSALFFHSALFHFTAPNTSLRKRRAVQFHYLTKATAKK
jgi:phytanoyl-CoA hydroxylase